MRSHLRVLRRYYVLGLSFLLPVSGVREKQLPSMYLQLHAERALLPAMGSINAAALRAIRELQEPRMTQEALARAVGIGPAHLSRIEAGVHKPRPHLVRALAEHLGVSIAAITNPHAECPNCSQKRAA